MRALRAAPHGRSKQQNEQLRDKLRDNPREPRFIRTVRSEGYQFIGKRATT